MKEKRHTIKNKQAKKQKNTLSFTLSLFHLPYTESLDQLARFFAQKTMKATLWRLTYGDRLPDSKEKKGNPVGTMSVQTVVQSSTF